MLWALYVVAFPLRRPLCPCTTFSYYTSARIAVFHRTSTCGSIRTAPPSVLNVAPASTDPAHPLADGRCLFKTNRLVRPASTVCDCLPLCGQHSSPDGRRLSCNTSYRVLIIVAKQTRSLISFVVPLPCVDPAQTMHVTASCSCISVNRQKWIYPRL
jgi:hypothetical protein